MMQQGVSYVSLDVHTRNTYYIQSFLLHQPNILCRVKTEKRQIDFSWHTCWQSTLLTTRVVSNTAIFWSISGMHAKRLQARTSNGVQDSSILIVQVVNRMEY